MTTVPLQLHTSDYSAPAVAHKLLQCPCSCTQITTVPLQLRTNYYSAPAVAHK